jgi:hypothetical protein
LRNYLAAANLNPDLDISDLTAKATPLFNNLLDAELVDASPAEVKHHHCPFTEWAVGCRPASRTDRAQKS